MSVQVIPQDQTLASNLGAGLGRGIADQLPEEIKRYRIQQGLKSISQQRPSTPFELISKLATIPGLDPGLIGVLAPALQQQLARNESLGSGNFGAPSSASGAPIFQQGPLAAQESAPLRREDRPGYLQEADPRAIDEYADRLFRSQPFRFPSYDAARSQAEKELNEGYRADVSYQARSTNLEKEFDDALKGYLQKDKELQEGEIGGMFRQDLLNQAKDELTRSKESPRVIAQRYAQNAYNLARAKQSLYNIKKKYSLFSEQKPTQKEIGAIRNVGEIYEKSNIPRQVFINDVQSSQNISSAAASYIADPIYETSAGKFAHSLKDLNILERLGAPQKNFDKKVAEQIASKITPKDPIGSLAYILAQKGYNADEVMKEVLRLKPNLSDQQKIDIGERQIPRRRTLDEILLMGSSGERKQARRVSA